MCVCVCDIISNNIRDGHELNRDIDMVKTPLHGSHKFYFNYSEPKIHISPTKV